jgi:hypothetical protein
VCDAVGDRVERQHGELEEETERADERPPGASERVTPGRREAVAAAQDHAEGRDQQQQEGGDRERRRRAAPSGGAEGAAGDEEREDARGVGWPAARHDRN